MLSLGTPIFFRVGGGRGGGLLQRLGLAAHQCNVFVVSSRCADNDMQKHSLVLVSLFCCCLRHNFFAMVEIRCGKKVDIKVLKESDFAMKRVIASLISKQWDLHANYCRRSRKDAV